MGGGSGVRVLAITGHLPAPRRHMTSTCAQYVLQRHRGHAWKCVQNAFDAASEELVAVHLEARVGGQDSGDRRRGHVLGVLQDVGHQGLEQLLFLVLQLREGLQQSMDTPIVVGPQGLPHRQAQRADQPRVTPLEPGEDGKNGDELPGFQVVGQHLHPTHQGRQHPVQLDVPLREGLQQTHHLGGRQVRGDRYDLPGCCQRQEVVHLPPAAGLD
mmetsp:Transcript_7481/g.18394  ORF Transcript_7481/g.18394 Transcript_7481/m.18394 type:complete len:214 (-) Transcript_7481:267-908(-)